MLNVLSYEPFCAKPHFRVRLKLKAWKQRALDRLLQPSDVQRQIAPFKLPLYHGDPAPAPWPNPWDHQDKTLAARCPRCGRDWSQPMSLYCPTCMGATSGAQAAA